MANLSDILGSGGSSAPQSGATLLQTVQSRRGWHEYRPGTPIQPGRYAVKCSANGRGMLRVSAPGAGVEVRNGNEAVINITQPVDSIQMSYENAEINPGVFRKNLPAFHPGSNYQGGHNYPIWSSVFADRSFGDMMASNEDGSVWVAIQGRQSWIRRSTDKGKTWYTIGRVDHLVGTTTTEYHVQTIVRFNNLFIVAAGWDSGLTTENGVSLISNDGLVWEAVDSSILTDISCATSSPTAYLAGKMGAGAGNNLVYSGDGRYFTNINPALNGNIINVQWDEEGEQFFATNDATQIGISNNGITWITFNTPVSFRSIIWYSGLYYGISTTGALYSAPALNTTTVPTWTLVANISGSGRHKFFIWNNYLYHHDGANGRIRRNNVIGTVNGTDWTTVTPVGIGNSSWVGLLRTGSGNIDSNAKLVAIWADQQVWLHTTDPLAARWDNYRPIVANSYWRDGIFDTANGRFLIGNDSGTIYKSTNLYNDWASVRGGSAVYKITEANGILMAGTSANQISYSTDGGDSWTNVAPGLNQCYGTAFGTDGVTERWITVGTQTDRLSRSDNNGVNWTVQTGITWGAAPRDVAWGPVTGEAAGAFIVVGDSGILHRSTDLGATWTRLDNQLPERFTEYNIGRRNRTRSWTKVKYLNGYFVAVGANIVAWSTDGLEWTYMDDERSFIINGTFNNVFWDSLKSRWVLTGNGGYIVGSTSLTDPRWKRIAVPQNGNAEMGAFVAGTVNLGTVESPDLQDLWFSGSASGRYWDSTDGDRWWYRDYDWSPSGTTYAGNYGYIPGETSAAYGYTGDVAEYGYVIPNTNIQYRTSDFNKFATPLWYNNMSGANTGLDLIVYGNGVWVGRGRSEAIWTSTNGWDWHVARMTDSSRWISGPRMHNVIFAEGYFWGIFAQESGARANWYSRLFRSKDGFNWETVYHWRSQDGQPPRWIRYTGNYWVAFGHRRDNTNDSRFFWYSNDLLSSPDHWTRGDTGELGNDWRISDVAVAEWGVVFAYEQNTSHFSYNLSGNYRDTRSQNQGMLLQDATVNASFGAWNAWSLGEKIYVTNGNNLFQVVRQPEQYNATNTNYQSATKTYQIGEWGNNGYHVQNTGVSLINGRGNLVYLMTAHTDTTFSLYNSTVPIYELNETIS